jgi:N-acetyl-gamma-glutamyl-phosphate/LysW-gamma-L-alpha-aminoadipyl-6-phosphate reductase
MSLTAAVIGGSGFTGGELLRLLADHPDLTVEQATSRQYTGRAVGYAHPNLRDLDLKFSDPADLDSVDVIFAATPHGVSMEHIDRFRDAADTVVDLSADFRLTDPAKYDEYYDGHDRPELLEESVYGLVELTRDELPGADLIACGGCNATATLLGLHPLYASGVVEPDDRLVVDVKVGSSEGGASGSQASHHAERSGIVRPYAPTGHRHEAEIEEWLGVQTAFTVHAVDMIRGASATCHVFPGEVEKPAVWRAYREQYGDEPFVQLIGAGGGVYRYPEPKVVAGTNTVEIGFELDEKNGRIVVFAAIDNMMKGSAGQAVHAANVSLGLDETAGLDLRGLHPVGAP